MKEHSANQRSFRSTRALAILAICASLLLAAVGFSATSAPSGTTVQIVRDPENPYWRGNTIGSSTTTTQTSQTVRDPENPYWVGNTIGSTNVGGGSTRGIK